MPQNSVAALNDWSIFFKWKVLVTFLPISTKCHLNQNVQCTVLAMGAQSSMIFKQKLNSEDIFSTKSADYETIYKYR